MLSRPTALVVTICLLLWGCSAAPPTPLDPTPAPPSATPAEATPSPCLHAVRAVAADGQALADSIVRLRAVVIVHPPDRLALLREMRAVSSALSYARRNLSEQRDRCPALEASVDDLGALYDALRVPVQRGLTFGTGNTEIFRIAGADVVALLGRLVETQGSLASAARQMGLDVDGMAVPPAALAPLPSPIPLATPTPKPVAHTTPRPTPRPTARPASRATPRPASGSGWTRDAYNTAVEWQDQVRSVYLGSLAGLLWELAYAGSSDGTSCGAPWTTPMECDAAREQWEPDRRRARAILDNHLSWMKKHPAASCFRDAYRADRGVAATYLEWLSGWDVYGGEDTPAGRSMVYALQDADAKRDRFLSKMGAYFSDCK